LAVAWIGGALVLFGLLGLIMRGGSAGDAAADVIIPFGTVFFLAGFAGIAVVVGSEFLGGRARTRREQEARHRIQAWARDRGLAYKAEGDLPEATPLLRRGDRRLARNLASGELPGGLPGVLAGYEYVDERENDDDKHYLYTLVVARLPEALGFVTEVTVAPRGRMASLGRLEDRARGRRRVELESAEMARRFQVRVAAEEDDNWVRQLFTPSFVDWLGTRAPDDLFFELREGVLCVAVPRDVTEPTFLEGFCRTASYVAARFRQEALEAARRPATARFAQRPSPAEPSAAVAALDWGAEPPPDVTAASRPFVPVARREPATWGWPLLWGAGAFVLSFQWLSDDESGSIPSLEVRLAFGAAVGLIVLALAARAMIRRRAGEYGKESFMRAYGAARGLVCESPRRFHARHVNAHLPGAAEFVLSGPFPRLSATGSLVLCGDHSRWSKDAEYEALVAPAGDERAPTLRLAPGAPLPPGLAAGMDRDLGLAREGGAVVVYAQRPRGTPLSVAELDAFVERAGRAVTAARA
jgi:hypothetical protein